MLKNLKLATKLFGSFAVILTLMAFVGGVGYQAMTGVADRSDKMTDVNTIVQLILEARQQEKNYMIRKDDESLKKHTETLTKIAAQTITTSDKFSQQTNKNQMTEVDKDTKAYLAAFQVYVDLDKKRAQKMEEMRTAGRTILSEVEKMLAEQKKILTESLHQKSESEDEIKERIGKIDDANQIVKLLIDARKNEKEFIISNGGQQWKENVLANLQTIKNLVSNLKSRFRQSANISRAEVVLAGITTYAQEFDGYGTLMGQQKQAETTMVDAAREAQKTCMDTLNDQKAKMQSQISFATTLLLSTCIIAFVIGVLLATIITRGITGPVNKAANLAVTMAKGDFTAILDIDQKDEIGVMAGSLNSMAGKLSSMIREIVEGVNNLSVSSSDLAAVSRQLSNSAQDTADKSGSVAASAEEMSVNIQSVSAAMEQSSANVSMVASATEEMTATVHEIGQSAEKARAISENAVMQSNITSEKVTALGESAKKINKVTETITEISEQTNLLALNATIEAARAGEAGKGFAVVANEIKELARQTAAATVDIKNQIDDMQSTTVSTIDDIGKISEVIAEINNAINGIATAVEEQSTATAEISNNISQASQGIAEVNENVAQSTIAVSDITRDISLINHQSAQVGDGSSQVQLNAQGLSALAVQLENLVKQFKICEA
ncbi:MAG: methyl-accepting chemotaxis protein [Pseudomonadota bacterium]